MGMSAHVWAGNGLCLVAIFLLQLIPMPFQQIAMLDIGQGDSLLFQDGTIQVLVDGGPGAQVLERLTEEMPWYDKKLEVVVVTHFDRDHAEGITHVLQRYEVGMVMLPNYRPTTNIGRQLISQIIDKKIPYRFGWYGQLLIAGGMQFRVMSPIPGQEWERLAKSKSNNASLIMRADIHDVSMLLTGDAEKGIETQLLNSVSSQALDVDILKVGHHGSKTSTSQQFLNVVTPSTSLISVSADNTYGHPTAEVLSRLTNTTIFRTDLNGTISFFRDENSWRVRCGNKSNLLFGQHVCINK